MAELRDSLLRTQQEACEAGGLARRSWSGSSPEIVVDAFSIEEADAQSRRRDRHMLKILVGAFGEASRLVMRHHRGTLLWFVVMIINTFATAFGALANDSRIDCSAGSNLTTTASGQADADVTQSPSVCSIETDDSNTATPGSQVVFGLSLVLFVCISIVVVVVSSCMDEVKGVSVWVKTHFVDVVMILSGTVYLAGANLSLVASLSLRTCVSIRGSLTMLSFRDIRNYLIALAFLISIIPEAFRKYWNVLSISTGVANGGSVIHNSNASNLPTHQHPKSKEPKGPKLRYLILQALFQMLAYIVHLDELYIIIQDEVSACGDDEEGRSCPVGFVTAGIVSFAMVSFLWVVISSVLVCKYAHDLDTAKIKQRKQNISLGTSEVYSLRQWAVELCCTRKHLGLFLFWLVLAMYIPAYLALNNAWPWICVARCQLQECEATNDGREERCMHYFNAKIVLLFLLGLGTIALLLAYWCVVLLKETDREKEEEELVVDTHNQMVQETEDPGNHNELALNSSQGLDQSQEIE